MLAVLLFVVAILFTFYRLCRSVKKPDHFPPGPAWVPIFGNLISYKNLSRQLNGQHVALSKLANDFNSEILGLKLGSQLVVVVLKSNLVREILLSDDFISRPDSFFTRLRCFGARQGITFADGPLWQEQRSFVVKTLRDQGLGKLQGERLVMGLVEDLISEFANNPGPQNVSYILSLCILRVLWEVTTGSRLSLKDPQLIQLIELLSVRNRAFDTAGGILNQFPWLRYIAPHFTGYSLLHTLNAKLRQFLSGTISQHKSKNIGGNNERDFIYAYMEKIEAGKEFYTGRVITREEQLLMILVDLFLGGATSTSTTLNFAFLYMIKYPDVQEKVYREILDVVGTDRLPRLSDKLRLCYTEAVLLEVQRVATVIPVTGPRQTMKDLNFHGYIIPKDTTVLISQWSVHHDEAVFPNPDNFDPQRFLHKTTRTQAVNNLIPFGLGKRRCVGEILAKQCMFLIFAGILQNFKLISTVTPDELVLEPNPGIILTPKTFACMFEIRNKSSDVAN